MCSATHKGFRVRRSKADVVESVGRRSEIGPGKPYWKSPLGFTGGTSSLRDRGGDAGTGGREDVVVEGVETVGEAEVALSRLRLEKIAAVVAAPAAADIPATTANVAFDILDYGVGRRFYAEQPANAQTYVLSGPERAAGIKLIIWTVSQSRVLQSSYWSSVPSKRRKRLVAHALEAWQPLPLSSTFS